jgi:hypothetical protein
VSFASGRKIIQDRNRRQHSTSVVIKLTFISRNGRKTATKSTVQLLRGGKERENSSIEGREEEGERWKD